MSSKSRYNNPIFARQYDSGEQVSHNGDIAFYTRLCRKPGIKVLELGCGTGRVTIPLKTTGIDITGLDFAPEMIKIARQKAAKANVKIPFHVADVVQYTRKEKFDCIIFPYNGMVLLSEKKFPAFIENLHHLLKENGVFAFDLSIPATQRRKKPVVVKTAWSDPITFQDLGVTIRRKITRRAVPAQHRMISTYKWEIIDKKGKKKIQKTTMQFLTYPLSWYIQQCTRAGFSIGRKRVIKKPDAATDHAFVTLQRT